MDGRHEPVRPSAVTGLPGNRMLRAQSALREAVLDPTRVLSDGILVDEALAEEITRIADGAAVGDPDVEHVLRAIARNHRIRVLEGQGRLAAVSKTYSHLIDPA